jgi:hypothetical protein
MTLQRAVVIGIGTWAASHPCLPADDGGITLEKEVSKEELLAVLELYREVRGASSDVTRLLETLAQMERHQVRGHKPHAREGQALI